jgi:hypothetical protein
MANHATLKALRETLSLLPVEWVLWSFDADWTMTVHEGPGLRRTAPGRVNAVGEDVRMRLGNRPGGPEFMRRVVRGPASAHITFGTDVFFVSGAPAPGGGAIGLSLPAGTVAGSAPELPPVLEVTRPIPAIGARTGDLLVWSPDDPERAGLFRRVGVDELPAEVRRELGRLRSPSDDAAGAPSASGATRSPRARASHLRLLP